MAIALGTFAAFAYAPAKIDSSVQSSLHWFDAVDGTYLGQRTQAQQQSICGTPQTRDCALGYNGEKDGEPVGTLQATLKRPNAN